MTFTERTFKDEAPELRAILASYPRISLTEERGWLFVHFTVTGDEPYISRCRQDIDAWRIHQAIDNAW